MLKKENRLFTLSGKSEKQISTPLFTIKILPNDGGKRFTFIISKKVDKRAVVRNKTKRKIRSLVEETLDQIKEGKDFIFYLKKDSVKIPREKAAQELREVFSKNRLLK